MPEAPSIQILDPEQTAVTAQKIKDMIDALSQTEDGEPLKNAMSKLKVALLENPTACALLLPEDIGEMVKYLMKVTGRDLEMQQGSSAKKKGTSTKGPVIDFTDPETLKKLEDDLF